MQYIPVKTRVMQPPQDDLWAFLDESVMDLRERDVVLISSKVVAIGEGRCVSQSGFDKEAHIKAEAEVVIPRPYSKSPLTITNHVMVSGAGVDCSNSAGYYTLLPADPFASAEQIYAYFKGRFNLSEFGIIITDSVSRPCRYGASAVAIGFCGIAPLQSHIGKQDLFGREIRVERTNVVDGIAAGANLIMGEVAEAVPIVIARNIPGIEFKEGCLKKELFCPPKDDVFRVLYERFL